MDDISSIRGVLWWNVGWRDNNGEAIGLVREGKENEDVSGMERQ